MTEELFQSLKAEELEAIKTDVGTVVYETGKYKEAAQLFEELILANEFADFLTNPAYEKLS